MAMAAALRHLGQTLDGARVAIQGVGNVGSELVRLLAESGATSIVADADPDTLRKLSVEVEIVPSEAITNVECDIFSPCGPPGVIDAVLAQKLPCKVVCGAANNPLEGPEVASVLQGRGVLYVPDFLSNAGGLIHLAVALEGGDEQASFDRLRVIPENLDRVLDQAKRDKTDPGTAAESLALAAIARGQHA